MKTLGHLICVLSGAAVVTAVQAAEPNARDWLPAPAGMHIGVGHYVHLESHGFYGDGDKIPASPKLKLQSFVWRQMYYSTLGGKTVQYEVIVPAARTRLDVSGVGREALTGVGDVVGGLAMWFHEDHDNRTYFAGEGFITLPTGRYRGSQADVSPGNNRWTGIVNLAFVQGVGKSSYLEAVLEVEFYGKNDNYYGQTLKKSPSWRWVALASTDLSESVYIGARYRFEHGGRERLNGAQVMRNARNHQLAAEITYQINDVNQVQLQYIHDVKVDNGPRMRGVQLRYGYVF